MMNTTLQISEKNALQAFTQQVENKYPAIRQIILYGSKARGDSTVDSDIDILVVLAQEDRLSRRDILTIAAQISLEYDVLLSPLVIGEKRLAQQREFTLYRNITNDAVQLAIRENAPDLLSKNASNSSEEQAG